MDHAVALSIDTGWLCLVAAFLTKRRTSLGRIERKKECRPVTKETLWLLMSSRQ